MPCSPCRTLASLMPEAVAAPTRCPLCGSSRHENVWEHETGVANGICLDCGHVRLTYLTMTPASEVYADFRQSYPDSYLLDPETPLFGLARSRAELLRRCVPALESVLEIGCGYGHFLMALGDVALRVGIEPSKEAAAFGREQFGLDQVRQESFEDIAVTDPHWPGRQLDAICSFHVLEHVRDPVGFLEFCTQRLRRGGVLIVAVPELHTLHPDLVELHFLKQQWHVHTFSEPSLRSLLTQCGLEIMLIEREAPTPMLRSSMLAVARFTGDPAAGVPVTTDIAAHRAALLRFHGVLDRGLAALRRQVGAWRGEARRVAVYGGGMHTQALFELAAIDVAAVDVIIDDDPRKAGDTIHGVPVQGYARVMSDPPDILLVSTLASEDVLLSRLRDSVPAGTEVYGIYRDFIN